MQTEPQENNAAVNALERRIDLTVPMADVNKEVEQRLRQMSRTVKMPGFRPGKVPMKLVAQQYGNQAQSEAITAAIEKAFGATVRAQNLRVAGYPRIEPKSSANDAVFEFTAIFEVFPEIVVGDIAGQTVEKSLLDVTDADVDKTIEILRKQRASFVATERPSENGDRMIIDFTGRRNGEVFEGGQATDFSVMTGAGSMLPEFDAALVGMTIGQTKNFDLTFPAEYHAKDLAGQTVQFEVTVKGIEAPQLPELDADFARALGIKDGDPLKMRTEIRANLEREVKKRLQARVKNQVMDAILAATPIDVPQTLVEAEARQMAENALKDFQQRGISNSQMPIDPSWFKDPALRRVKLGLILSELVKEQNLQAKPEQVRTVVDEFAETFEDPKEVVRWYYSQPQRLADAEALVVENNVVDWVLARAKVNEKAVAFDELMGNAA